ncbi:MAG: ABC transporter permease, partial [Pseudomonadota bacterium]
MNLKRLRNSLAAAVTSVAALAAMAPEAAIAQETQYFPVASSRVGPYSAMGTGYYGAQIDYMNYV